VPNSEDERAAIMRAAYIRLTQPDVATVGVNDILESAGLSTRAFYRHFASKDDLLLALLRRESDQLSTRLAAAVSTAASPEEALTALISSMLEITARPRLRQRAQVLGSEHVQRARGSGAERRRFQAAQEAAVAEILVRGRAQGGFPWAAPESDAKQICAALRQAFDDQVTGAATVTADEAAAQVSSFALRALGSRRPPG
jgi:AcrR family transcriptional regulator